MDKRKMTFGTRSAARWLCGVAMLWLSGGVTLAADVVTIHSNSAGTLALTPQALTATRLKVTGNIDARDFETLKAATMTATRELDLSEAVIDEYYGYGGSYSPITPDWVVGTGKPRTYHAGMIPIHAFTSVGDNSLTKWHYGSYSLTRLILPRGCRGVEPDAFANVTQLTELVAAGGDDAIVVRDNAVYTADLTRLVAVAPAYTGILRLPPQVTSVADSVLHGLTLRGIELERVASVDFGQQGDATVGYLLAPGGGDYAEAFASVDITDAMDEATVTVSEAGSLLRLLGEAGWTRDGVRSLRVSGTVDDNDLYIACSLPNLHRLDLSGAQYEGTTLIVRSAALIELKLPRGAYSLDIESCPLLGGELAVPEGVTSVSGGSDTRLTALTLPMTVEGVARDAFSGSLLRHADLSACTKLKVLNYVFTDCANLSTLLLPASLEALYLEAPVESITLPDGLRRMAATGWHVATLALPQGLQTVSGMQYMLCLHSIDASQAAQLRQVSGLDYCPLITSADFSAAPIEVFTGLSFDYPAEAGTRACAAKARTAQRVVVTGGKPRPHVESMLTELRLPSTLQTLSGLDNCHRLASLDLGGCSNLRSVSIGTGMAALASLRLPPDVLEVGSLSGCTALRDVYCAANLNAPTLAAGSDAEALAQATLHVPNGSRGLYAMAEGWSAFGNIVEDGWTVRTVSMLEGVPMSGGGLYPDGATVTLAAPTAVRLGITDYSLEQWAAAGVAYTGGTAQFSVTDHVTAEAIYDAGRPDLSQCDITFTLALSAPTEVRVGIDSYSGFAIYNEQGLINEGNTYGGGALSLDAGTSRYGIVVNEDPTYLNMWLPQAEGTATISDFAMRPMPTLAELDICGMGLAAIDLSPMPALQRLFLQGNRLTALDASPCPQLEWVNCSMNALTALDLSTNHALQTLYCYNNRLTRMAISPSAQLVSLGCDMNSFGFSQLESRLVQPIRNYMGVASGPFGLEYLPPFDLGTGDVLDLSGEQLSADGHPVSIRVTADNTALTPDGGRYAISKTGSYYVEMTCAAMPDVTFRGLFNVTGPSAIASLPLDGIGLRIDGLTVTVAGLPSGASATLLTASGNTVAAARGGNISLTARQGGIHILRLADGAGRTQAVKLRLK